MKFLVDNQLPAALASWFSVIASVPALPFFRMEW